MKNPQPSLQHTLLRRAATAAALFCGAASGAALLYAKSARDLRRQAIRAARVRRDLSQLDAALDRYASDLDRRRGSLPAC